MASVSLAGGGKKGQKPGKKAESRMMLRKYFAGLENEANKVRKVTKK